MAKICALKTFLFAVLCFIIIGAREASALGFGIYGQYKTASPELNSNYGVAFGSLSIDGTQQ